MKLAEYVLDYRERHNLSQRDFARQCGCSFQYISKLERNEVTNPSKKMMSKLAYGMGMDLTTLYALIDDYGRIPGTDIPSGSNETVRRIAEKLHLKMRFLTLRCKKLATNLQPTCNQLATNLQPTCNKKRLSGFIAQSPCGCHRHYLPLFFNCTIKKRTPAMEDTEVLCTLKENS